MQPNAYHHNFTKSKQNKLGYSNQTKTTKLVKLGERESWLILNTSLLIGSSILQEKKKSVIYNLDLFHTVYAKIKLIINEIQLTVPKTSLHIY